MRTKLPDTGTTIFSVMSQLANEHQAINLGQGFPGFPIDPELVELVSKAMRDGYNQYAPMPGWMPLREKLAEKIALQYEAEVNPETELTITSGATQALFTAITAIVHPNDEVILFAPAYDCYEPAVKLCGAKPVWINLTWPDFTIPWEKLAEAITTRTRLIVINNPGNPSGSILSKDDLSKLQELIRGKDIILLSDEVYEHLIFDDCDHQSVFRFPELRERSMAVYSFGKTFHATGWKLGYIVGPPALMNEFRKVHQYNVFSSNMPIQVALTQYLSTPENYLRLGEFYQRKRDLFLSHLEGSRFSWKPAAGTYFQLLSYAEISELDEVDAAKAWTIQHRVASIPISSFYPDQRNQQVLRFCFAKEDEMLEKAADILRTI